MPEDTRVGEVVEASTSGFVAQCHRLYDAPPLGALVRCGPPAAAVYAIVAEVATRSLDPGRRPTAVGHEDDTDDDVYRRNPQLSRLLSTEITAVTVGHVAGDSLLRYLPPSPPRIHAFVSLCTTAELRRLSDSLDFLPGVLSAPVASPDDVAAAFLRQASVAHDDPEAFLVAAGRNLAVLLGAQIPAPKLPAKEARAVNGNRLGMVVGGSLTEGVNVKLDPGASVEDVRVGSFVSIQGERMRFFGVVTDVVLDATDQAMRGTPPDVSNPFIARVVSGTAAYGALKVEPMLTIGGADAVLGEDGPSPAKTIPAHFSTVSAATEADIETVFGAPSERNFWIGNPMDMEAKLCLNVEELVKRSNGVFGKSGTGKTFLTRLLLIGILQGRKASNLVFDMQSEYGWKGYSEGGAEVKGLKQLFSSQVALFSLDEESSKRRGINPDYVVRIGYEEVEPEDVAMLRETLGLSEVAADAAFSLQREYGRRWLNRFLELSGREEVGEVADRINVNQSALITLQNRLRRLARLDFMDKSAAHDSVNRIIEYLDRGMHVVLEFGRHGSNLAAYILVANLLTRRIHDRYVDRKERAMGDPAQEPRPLVITIEEAHKFLTPSVASQTTFGAIAREMRKYNVTLLVVDQRPSGIDDEVISQLGTKITCLLDNDKDVDAVLTGVSGSRKLRTVLSRLESKQQALAFGHALPMPVVFETREYGSAESYRDLGWRDAVDLKAEVERDLEDLFGPSDP